MFNTEAEKEYILKKQRMQHGKSSSRKSNLDYIPVYNNTNRN